MKARRASERRVTKKLRIEWTYPENLKSYFVDNILVQHQKEWFILSFFEVWPPAILEDNPEEAAKVLESMDKVEAKCVARLVVTPTKMRQLLKAIQTNVERYEAKLQEGIFEESEEE